METAGRVPGARSACLIIEPTRGWRGIDVREMWRHRELLYFLIWRDVKVRYKQTVLGAAWAILQPLATMVVFSVFLGRVAGVRGVAYPLFLLAGLLPWTFFANAITSASQSVVSNQSLVTKVYFPRLLVPAAAVGASVVDLIVSLGILAVMMAWYAVVPGWGGLLAPLLILLLVLTALGAGTLLAALTVAYRDFRYVVPFGIQLWMFATPCIYLQADTVVGPHLLALLPLNPAYGLILNFRQVVLGEPLDGYSLVVSAASGLGLLLLGAMYFRRVERNFADVI
jgi:lipopolysaccharide transport system permease protein